MNQDTAFCWRRCDLEEEVYVRCQACKNGWIVVGTEGNYCPNCGYKSRPQVEQMVDSRNLSGPLFVPPTTRKPYPGERT
jgi:hypothetical protein